MLSKYKFFFVDDLKSGLVVSLVALPLCLGIALASGAPLISGVFAGIVGGIIVGAASNSHVSVSGPAAGLAVIVLGAIQNLQSFNVFLTSVVIAGSLQVIFGLFQLGNLAKKIHHSVIEGMLASIGILIILKQIPYAFGIIDFRGYSSIVFSTDYFNTGALLIGSLCLLSIITYNITSLKTFFIFQWIPLSICLVVVSSLIAYFLKNASLALHINQFVNIGAVGSGASLLTALQYPDFSQILTWPVMKYGIIIALVASIETLLCVEAGDKLDSQKRTTSSNRELKAQGIGNIISGFIGGLPITSVIVRTSVNIHAGAKTKVSAIVHGIILLMGLLLFPQFVTKIPLAVLACILLHAGYNLSNPHLLKKMFLKSKNQSIPFFSTIVLVITTDLLMGVICGQIIAIIVSYFFKEKKQNG